MLFLEKNYIILRRLSEDCSVGGLCVCGYQAERRCSCILTIAESRSRSKKNRVSTWLHCFIVNILDFFDALQT
jgi:hypothetical protein